MNTAVADSKVLVSFLNAEGQNTGAPLEIPLDTTTNQLQVFTLTLVNKYFVKYMSYVTNIYFVLTHILYA